VDSHVLRETTTPHSGKPCSSGRRERQHYRKRQQATAHRHPLRTAEPADLEVFIRREDAERFIEQLRGDEPEIGRKCGTRSGSLKLGLN
jgi:hypothetical protein